ncbi:Trehalase [Aphelenchoides besseyi]|nr:Trehalase [Aphelenchoides besseyi]
MTTRLKLVIVLLFSIFNEAFAWQQFFTNDRIIDEYDQVCSSTIPNRIVYCGGRLIEAVNYHALYADSKDFVDSPMKYSPMEVMSAFNQTFPMDIRKIDRNELIKFVEAYFEKPSTELIECIPPDWTPEPPEIMKIQDPTLRAWALDLNALWKTLCRRIDPKVSANIDKHSIIQVEHNFIIPGLLVSGMVETAKGMARNLISMVYYTKRSQPPMLTPIVYAIYEKTDEIDFVKEAMPALEKEFNFWQTERKDTVTMKNNETREVYFYRAQTFTPRPESMRADLNQSDGMDVQSRRLFFQSSASATESGWDFSSRWFADRKTIQTIETAKIAPVDLNSYVCWNMQILEYLSEVQGDFKKARMYEQMHTEFRYTLNEVFYNEEYGAWYDLNTSKKLFHITDKKEIGTNDHIVHNFPSVATPLFTGCYDLLDTDKPRRLFKSLLETGFFNFSGGIPTSLVSTNQQWDFPNGWAPTNHQKSANPEMQDKGFEVAMKWIYGNYKVYNSTRKMFEKYDVVSSDTFFLYFKSYFSDWQNSRAGTWRRIRSTNRLRVVKWCYSRSPFYLL